MLKSESDVPGVGIWLVAVLGAGAVMVSPITPWFVPVEVLGLISCLVATAALVLRFVRQ